MPHQPLCLYLIFTVLLIFFAFLIFILFIGEACYFLVNSFHLSQSMIPRTHFSAPVESQSLTSNSMHKVVGLTPMGFQNFFFVSYVSQVWLTDKHCLLTSLPRLIFCYFINILISSVCLCYLSYIGSISINTTACYAGHGWVVRKRRHGPGKVVKDPGCSSRPKGKNCCYKSVVKVSSYIKQSHFIMVAVRNILLILLNITDFFF